MKNLPRTGQKAKIIVLERMTETKEVCKVIDQAFNSNNKITQRNKGNEKSNSKIQWKKNYQIIESIPNTPNCLSFSMKDNRQS